jgi:hypothetical protein
VPQLRSDQSSVKARDLDRREVYDRESIVVARWSGPARPEYREAGCEYAPQSDVNTGSRGS